MKYLWRRVGGLNLRRLNTTDKMFIIGRQGGRICELAGAKKSRRCKSVQRHGMEMLRSRRLDVEENGKGREGKGREKGYRQQRTLVRFIYGEEKVPHRPTNDLVKPAFATGAGV
jgi:hypothetical protein